MTTTKTMPVLGVFSTVGDALTEWDEMLRAEPDLTAGSFTGKADDGIQAGPEITDLDLSPIARPTGEMYHPRKLDDKLFGNMSDVRFVCTAWENRMPVLLYGAPGTGKTALLEAALPNLVTVVGTAETEVSDFVGNFVPNGNKDQEGEPDYLWVDGPLTVAVENGWPMMIDEIALIDPRVMAVVYSLMDGRDTLPITSNPSRGTVKAKDGFMVFGACNPYVPGAIMSDALLSRFNVHIEVKTDWDLARKLGCGTRIISACRNLEKQGESAQVVAPPNLREALTFRNVTKSFGEKVAVANFIAQARPEDRDAFATVAKSLWTEFTPAPLNFG